MRQRWSQRLAQLDALIDSLGLPSTYMLLAVVPASGSAAIASKAVCPAMSQLGKGVSAISGSDVYIASRSSEANERTLSQGDGSGDSCKASVAVGGFHDSSLTATEAATVVKWYRGLAGRQLHGRLAEELHARGLLAPLMPVNQPMGSRVAGG